MDFVGVSELEYGWMIDFSRIIILNANGKMAVLRRFSIILRSAWLERRI